MGRWYRGNTHAHSTRSDGDLPPEGVAAWYREHGYDFVCLTDHFVAPEPGLAASLSDGGFLVIPGQELSALVNRIPVHVNAFGVEETVPEPKGMEVGSVLKEMTALARERTRVISVNHPNFYAAFGAAEMLDIDEPFLLEVWNGHPQVFNFGWPGRAGVESMWDELLTAGRTVWGVACDDSHHYREDVPRHPHGLARAGLGWVNVWAEELTTEPVLSALLAGDFYASTGVELGRVEAREGRYLVETTGETGRFLFTGPGGQVLEDQTGTTGSINLGGREGYVRATILGEKGALAWTQPVFLDARASGGQAPQP
jgi:hypothetical protein